MKETIIEVAYIHNIQMSNKIFEQLHPIQKEHSKKINSFGVFLVLCLARKQTKPPPTAFC